MVVSRFQISFKASDLRPALFNLDREVFQQPVLHLKPLALVVGLEQPEPGHLDIQVHLLFN